MSLKVFYLDIMIIKDYSKSGVLFNEFMWLDYLSNYDESLNEIRNDYIMEDCGFFKKMIMRFWMRLSGFYYYKILPYSKLFADSYLK